MGSFLVATLSPQNHRVFTGYLQDAPKTLMVKQTQLISTNILMRKRQKSNDGCAQVAVPVPWPVLPPDEDGPGDEGDS